MIFVLTLVILSFLCLILYLCSEKLKTNKIVNKQEPEFLKLQNTYLAVYLLAVGNLFYLKNKESFLCSHQSLIELMHIKVL